MFGASGNKVAQHNLSYAHYMLDEHKSGDRGSLTLEKPFTGSVKYKFVYNLSGEDAKLFTSGSAGKPLQTAGASFSVRDVSKVRDGLVDVSFTPGRNSGGEENRTRVEYQTTVDKKNKYTLSLSASGGPIGFFKKDQNRKARLTWDVTLDDIDALQVAHTFGSEGDRDTEVKLTHRVDNKWTWDATYHYASESFSANVMNRLSDGKSVKVGGNFKSKAYMAEFKAEAENGGPYIIKLRGKVDEDTKMRETLNRSSVSIKRRFDF